MLAWCAMVGGAQVNLMSAGIQKTTSDKAAQTALTALHPQASLRALLQQRALAYGAYAEQVVMQTAKIQVAYVGTSMCNQVRGEVRERRERRQVCSGAAGSYYVARTGS